MTLWELAARWLREHRPHRTTWVTVWPHMAKPQRFNFFQKWMMRRGALLLLLLILFKINPFGTTTLALTIIGGTLAWVEHRSHQRQQRSLYWTAKRRDIKR